MFLFLSFNLKCFPKVIYEPNNAFHFHKSYLNYRLSKNNVLIEWPKINLPLGSCEMFIASM